MFGSRSRAPGGLWLILVRSAAAPAQLQRAFLGTPANGLGIVGCAGGAAWSPTNEGPTNCAIMDMFWMGEKLVAVTHGRGMFQIDLSGA